MAKFIDIVASHQAKLNWEYVFATSNFVNLFRKNLTLEDMAPASDQETPDQTVCRLLQSPASVHPVLSADLAANILVRLRGTVGQQRYAPTDIDPISPAALEAGRGFMAAYEDMLVAAHPGDYAYCNSICSDLTPEGLAVMTAHPEWITEDFSCSECPGALELLARHPKMICWTSLSMNASPLAIPLLRTNLSEVQWFLHCEYATSMELLREYPAEVCWDVVSANPSPDAIAFLGEHLANVDWDMVCNNPTEDTVALVALLRRCPDPARQLNWSALAMLIIDQGAVEDFLCENMERMDWSACWLHTINDNPLRYAAHIDWDELSKNKYLFV
jgi:hypothetical protein